ANDLHVNVGGSVVDNPPDKAPTAPGLDFVHVGPSDINFTSAKEIPPGTSVPVTWTSTVFSITGFDTITGGNWTQDGIDIGPVLAPLIQVVGRPSATRPDQVLIFIDDNASSPLPFTQLSAFEHVDQSFFDTADYIRGM